MIILLWPPQNELYDPIGYPPQGLMHLSAYLLKNNIEVKLVNLANFSGTDDELLKRIPEVEWYGISMTTPLYASTKRLVNVLRKNYPKSKIILGGVHATLLPEETYKDLCPDYLVTRDGETALVSIIKEKPRKGIIKGAFLEVKNLPLPNRSLLDYNWIATSALHGKEDALSTTVITSRGCPFACAYCCKYDGRKVRYRTSRQVFDELSGLKNIYGIEHVRFVDDVFTLNVKRLEEICRLIKPLDMTWLSITRADLVNETILKYMKEAGNIELCFGVESGSNDQLKRMNKIERIEKIESAILLAKAMGISVKVFLLFGFPGETRKTVEETMHFMERVKPDKYTMSSFVPLPGSDVFSNPKKYNIEIISKSWEDYWFYWEIGEKRGHFIKYQNEDEIYKLRDELKLFLAEGKWKTHAFYK